MGATLRPKEADIDQPGNLLRLDKWISSVRNKKCKYSRSRRRNIRVEAVLSHALSQAQQELRNVQIARVHKWQHLKQLIAEKEAAILSKKRDSNNNMDNNDGKTGHADSNEEDCQDKDIWSNRFYPELSSFDDFMSKLGEIKSPIQR